MAAARSGRGMVAGNRRIVGFVSSWSVVFGGLAILLLAVAMMMGTPAVIGAEQFGHSSEVKGDDSAAQGVNGTEEESILPGEEDEKNSPQDEASHNTRDAERKREHDARVRDAYPGLRRDIREAHRVEHDFFSATGAAGALRKKARIYAGLSGAGTLAMLAGGLYGSVKGRPDKVKSRGGLLVLQAGMAGAAALALLGLVKGIKSLKKKSEKESQAIQAMDRIVQMREHFADLKHEFWHDSSVRAPADFYEHRLDDFAHIHDRGKYFYHDDRDRR